MRGGRAVRETASKHITARVSRAEEGRALSRPLSDGRMASCPVVPMVDDPMTARCPGNAALLLVSPGDVGILPAMDARESDPPAHWRCGFQPRNASPLPGARAASPAYFKAVDERGTFLKTEMVR